MSSRRPSNYEAEAEAEPERLLSTAELADALGVSRQAVNRAAAAGRIPVAREAAGGRGPGRGRQFRLADVLAASADRRTDDRPLTGPGRPPRGRTRPRVRFLASVRWEGDHLLWRSEARRPMFSLDGRQVDARRASWVLFRGPVPDGLYPVADCAEPDCLRADHLVLVDRRELVRRTTGAANRARAAARTHCSRGHALTEDNTFLYEPADGRPRRRICRTCARDRSRALKARRRAEKKETQP